MSNLIPPCTYQGGKQRFARQIIDYIDSQEQVLSCNRIFHDVCCGSGAVSLELINRGFPVSYISMCDSGLWGEFYALIASGLFDMQIFEKYLNAIPSDKALIKDYMLALANTDALRDTAYKFLLLQACSFGGKQVWRNNHQFRHSSFRNYWQPTATCVSRFCRGFSCNAK